MFYRQDIAFSLILVPTKSELRGVPKIIGTNPLKYYVLPVFV
jgi:hypothetical protein